MGNVSLTLCLKPLYMASRSTTLVFLFVPYMSISTFYTIIFVIRFYNAGRVSALAQFVHRSTVLPILYCEYMLICHPPCPVLYFTGAMSYQHSRKSPIHAFFYAMIQHLFKAKTRTLGHMPSIYTQAHLAG